MRRTIAPSAAAPLAGTAGPAPARSDVRGHSERLLARARRGDHVARTALVEEHMGLVRSLALRYRDLGLPVEDLVQEGAIGLLSAIDDYDPGRGATFSTYAFWRIRAAVTHALSARGHLVRLPRPVLEHRRDVAQARERLASAGREPSVTTLAEAATLPEREVVQALAPTSVVSLDQARIDRTPFEPSAGETASPEARLLRSEERRAVRGAVRRLTGRKRAIVSRHFGLAGKPETLAEIADDLELSPERTRALKDEALRELAVELEPAIGA
ncbi:MAG TPA: sigma-70 family RNA polymerase sigma factor [Gaiellaceae bacterium]|nr:sigma-70 family RNA polymerase sigma factor [Gaiellaceae bacterium]